MPSVIRVYKFRLYPTATQENEMLRVLGCLRFLYNACLQERRDAYKAGVKVSKSTQEKAITVIKNDPGCPDYANIHTHLLQDVVKRVDRSFQSFFDRVKAGKKPGYPRFKGRDRYNTFTFKDAASGNGAEVVAGGKRVRLSGIGNVKVKCHRPMEGELKTIGVTRDGCGHWYALIAREIPAHPLPASDAKVGIDLNLTKFAVLSDGSVVDNPRHLREARIALERKSRVMARRKRGSKRRQKARTQLAKAHTHVANARRDFHHKTARAIVEKFGFIAIEDLNVKGLASGMLAKYVNDAAWGQFATILSEKAVDAARVLARVDPRGTTPECSDCGEYVPKDLSVRVHECPKCGLVMDRDLNSSIVIEDRAFAPDTRPGRGRRREASNGNL